jgi:tetrapyrrole methylase family protein/MazG family protein
MNGQTEWEPARESGAAMAFRRLEDIVIRLRGPGGCPWDREQTPASLRDDLLEETYECVEAIGEKDPAHIREELGDLFLLVTMLSYMYEQEGAFTVTEAINGISEKLMRRHPHVFGGAAVKDSVEALENWARIKVEQEGRAPRDSVLDTVPRSLPPLDRAWKLQKKAAAHGFDWPDVSGVIAKVKEELAETEAALAGSAGTAKGKKQLEDELGDLLFSVANLCRYLKMEPSIALHAANAKFISRFKHVEKRMKETRQTMRGENLDTMDGFWNEAKTREG